MVTMDVHVNIMINAGVVIIKNFYDLFFRKVLLLSISLKGIPISE